MWLFCWLFGHHWFPTVRTHATHEGYPWDWGKLDRSLFEEKLCLRCGHQQADHIETLDSWEPGGYGLTTAEESAAHAKIDQPTEHFGLPGDWGVPSSPEPAP